MAYRIPKIKFNFFLLLVYKSDLVSRSRYAIVLDIPDISLSFVEVQKNYHLLDAHCINFHIVRMFTFRNNLSQSANWDHALLQTVRLPIIHYIFYQ